MKSPLFIPERDHITPMDPQIRAVFGRPLHMAQPKFEGFEVSKSHEVNTTMCLPVTTTTSTTTSTSTTTTTTATSTTTTTTATSSENLS